MSIEWQVARFMSEVAEAVQSVKSGETSCGEFYVSEVRIGFDGEDTGYRILPNEHGEFDIGEVSA